MSLFIGGAKNIKKTNIQTLLLDRVMGVLKIFFYVKKIIYLNNFTIKIIISYKNR